MPDFRVWLNGDGVKRAEEGNLQMEETLGLNFGGVRYVSFLL